MKRLASLAIPAILLVAGCATQSPVIENGVNYPIVSFGTVEVESKEGELVKCYLVTFTYPVAVGEDVDGDPGKKTRGTINVPKDCLLIDRTLPVNALVFDTPRTIEGQTYVTARWNPREIKPSVTEEKVIEEDPPMKK